MPRACRAYPLPPPRRPLERVECSNCGRTWGVYAGTIPRMWTRFGDKLLCDTHACNAELERLRDEARKAAAAQQPSPLRSGRNELQADGRAPCVAAAAQLRCGSARPRG